MCLGRYDHTVGLSTPHSSRISLARLLQQQAMNPFRTGKLVLFQVTYDRDWHFFEIIFFVVLGIFGVSPHCCEHTVDVHELFSGVIWRICDQIQYASPIIPPETSCKSCCGRSCNAGRDHCYDRILQPLFTNRYD